MTAETKTKIRHLRAQGMSYGKIASYFNMSINTIKSYCRRNNLQGLMKAEDKKKSHTHCKHCSRGLNQKNGSKQKKFCSDACRYTYWNKNRDKLNPDAVHITKCAECGTAFENYGRQKRKYCSHTCYIKHRFYQREVGDAV